MFAKLKRIKKRDQIILAVAIITIPIIAILSLSTSSNDKNLPICNGKDVFENCIDEKGVKYAKYIYREATKEITETINHPAQPVKNSYSHSRTSLWHKAKQKMYHYHNL